MPQAMPIISGRANSRMELTPIAYSTATMIKVVREVKMLLDSVWVMLRSTSSGSSSLPSDRRFSRIRSKITMVALME